MCYPRGEKSMPLGLQIAATCCMLSIGHVLKARYAGGMGGTMLVCNADSFPGTPFGWFYPRPISLIAWQNVPPLALLNDGRCECLCHDLALLFFVRERSDELLEGNLSFARVSMLSGTIKD